MLLSRRHFVVHVGALAASVLALSAATTSAHAAVVRELRVMTHASFDLPKELLEGFEKQQHVQLKIIKAGDAGEMLNKLILTKSQPIADVVYGLDNSLIAKAEQAGILAPLPATTLKADALSLGPQAAAVDYGYVTINIDKAWFEQHKLALPTSLEDLTKPAYRNLLVVQHPATSSPGFAFMASTIAHLGEKGAWDWWKAMRANGVKVAKGWSEAYYTDFSRNGGSRPLVVSYSTSPAAEVFYSKTPLSQSPTQSLSMPGAVFKQIEGVSLIKNSRQSQAGLAFIEFMRSTPVQEALQTTMWMLPVNTQAKPAAVIQQHAPQPQRFDNPSPAVMAKQGPTWVKNWTRLVLK